MKYDKPLPNHEMKLALDRIRKITENDLSGVHTALAATAKLASELARNSDTASLVHATAEAINQMEDISLSPVLCEFISSALEYNSQRSIHKKGKSKNIDMVTGNSKIHISLSNFITLASLVVTVMLYFAPSKTDDLLQQQNEILSDSLSEQRLTNKYLKELIDSATSSDPATAEVLEDIKKSLDSLSEFVQEELNSVPEAPESSTNSSDPSTAKQSEK